MRRVPVRSSPVAAAVAALAVAACTSSASRQLNADIQAAVDSATKATRDSMSRAQRPAATAPASGNMFVAPATVNGIGGRAGVLSTPPGPPVSRATRVAYVDSMKGPESVKYDAEQDAYYVSNVNGLSAAKDGNGFISRLTGDAKIDRLHWIVSKPGAVLNAPKGMALSGDTLWVADIDVVRGFDRRSGAPVATVDLAGMGAKFLNDVVVGPDGALYVTDTGIRYESNGLETHPGPDRIFRIAGRAASVAVESPRLNRPNGIAWDARQSRFLIVPMGSDTVVSWQPGSATVIPVALGPGQHDGVIVMPDGAILVSSWATSAVHVVNGAQNVRVIEHVASPADIEFDAKHSRVAVPLLGENRVEFYTLK